MVPNVFLAFTNHYIPAFPGSLKTDIHASSLKQKARGLAVITVVDTYEIAELNLIFSFT